MFRSNEIWAFSAVLFACVSAGCVGGGCLLYLDRSSRGPWLLSARPGSTTCEVFAGTYEVVVDHACQTAAPGIARHEQHGRL